MPRKERKNMYNTNSYMGNMQYNTQPYNSYGYNNYGMYQPQVQNQIQKPVQPQDFPFSVVRFGTLDEAKAHIVPPSKAIMFIKSDFSEIYVKSADAMGNPALETFKCSRVDENMPMVVSPVLDTKDFVKIGDINDVVRKDDLKGLLTAEDGKNFITKDDLKGISSKLDQLDKQIKMTELWKGGNNIGK
jgi:hypothetical protein